ncbi:Uncharacterised protein [Segatella copri]|nr:Uncharacterised protein [Segatella copri]
MLTLRTIIARRLANCNPLYHFLSSSGSLASTESFTFMAVSTFEMILIWLLSTFLYLSGNTLPSSVLAFTISRLVFLPWRILNVVSGRRVISRSKARLFLGNAFFGSAACSFASCFFFFFSCFLRCICALLWVRSNLSFTFFRKGTWL